MKPSDYVHSSGEINETVRVRYDETAAIDETADNNYHIGISRESWTLEFRPMSRFTSYNRFSI
jgi:hypothetical protein